MKVKIPFNLIRVNQMRGDLEIVFPYSNEWYRLDWKKVPDKFKVLYVVYLRLQGIEIPDYLKNYGRDIVDVSDVSIEIELDKCEKVPATYPLG